MPEGINRVWTRVQISWTFARAARGFGPGKVSSGALGFLADTHTEPGEAAPKEAPERGLGCGAEFGEDPQA